MNVEATNGLYAKVEEKYPGVKGAQRRQMALLHIRTFCVAFAAALASASSQTKAACQMIYNRYKSAVQATAINAGVSGPGNRGRKLDTQADWLTEVIKGVAISYACRFQDCRWYGMNHQWVVNSKQAQYRCPRCKREYKPWSQARGELCYQKAVHLVSPGSGKVVAFPVKWPGSQADSFFLECCEVHAANLRTDQDLDEFVSDAVWKLEDVVKRLGIVEGMKKFEWDSSNEHMLSANWPKDGQFGWGRLVGGYHGGIIPPPPKGVDWDAYTFADWDELVAAVGGCIYAGQQIAARM